MVVSSMHLMGNAGPRTMDMHAQQLAIELAMIPYYAGSVGDHWSYCLPSVIRQISQELMQWLQLVVLCYRSVFAAPGFFK